MSKLLKYEKTPTENMKNNTKRIQGFKLWVLAFFLGALSMNVSAYTPILYTDSYSADSYTPILYTEYDWWYSIFSW